jgi:WD40 repeat protein
MCDSPATQEFVMHVFAVSSKKIDVDRVEFSPDGSLLTFCATQCPVGLYSVQKGELAFPGQIKSFRDGTRTYFHPSGKWMIGTGSYGGLAVWNLETKQTVHEPEAKPVVLTFAQFTPDGKFLLYAYYFVSGNEYERGLECREWKPEDWHKLLWTTPVYPDYPGRGWNCGLVALADAERFATAEFSMESHGRASLRSVRSGEVLATRHIPGYDSPTLAVSADNSLFATLVKRHLYVWTKFEREEKPRTLTNDGKKHFTGIAFHPSGRYLAATSNDQSVKFYDTTTWQVANTFTWDIGKMRSIAFSPDGTLAAAGSDSGKVIIWDVDL